MSLFTPLWAVGALLVLCACASTVSPPVARTDTTPTVLAPLALKVEPEPLASASRTEPLASRTEPSASRIEPLATIKKPSAIREKSLATRQEPSAVKQKPLVTIKQTFSDEGKTSAAQPPPSTVTSTVPLSVVKETPPFNRHSTRAIKPIVAEPRITPVTSNKKVQYTPVSRHTRSKTISVRDNRVDHDVNQDVMPHEVSSTHTQLAQKASVKKEIKLTQKKALSQQKIALPSRQSLSSEYTEKATPLSDKNTIILNSIEPISVVIEHIDTSSTVIVDQPRNTHEHLSDESVKALPVSNIEREASHREHTSVQPSKVRSAEQTVNNLHDNQSSDTPIKPIKKHTVSISTTIPAPLKHTNQKATVTERIASTVFDTTENTQKTEAELISHQSDLSIQSDRQKQLQEHRVSLIYPVKNTLKIEKKQAREKKSRPVPLVVNSVVVPAIDNKPAVNAEVKAETKTTVKPTVKTEIKPPLAEQSKIYTAQVDSYRLQSGTVSAYGNTDEIVEAETVTKQTVDHLLVDDKSTFKQTIGNRPADQYGSAPAPVTTPVTTPEITPITTRPTVIADVPAATLPVTTLTQVSITQGRETTVVVAEKIAQHHLWQEIRQYLKRQWQMVAPLTDQQYQLPFKHCAQVLPSLTGADTIDVIEPYELARDAYPSWRQRFGKIALQQSPGASLRLYTIKQASRDLHVVSTVFSVDQALATLLPGGDRTQRYFYGLIAFGKNTHHGQGGVGRFAQHLDERAFASYLVSWNARYYVLRFALQKGIAQEAEFAPLLDLQQSKQRNCRWIAS